MAIDSSAEADRDDVSGNGKHGEKGSFRCAFEETLTACLFAISVGIVIAALLVLEVRPVRLLQSWGFDIGLKIFAQPASWYMYEAPADQGIPFVFIDLEGFSDRACVEFVQGRREEDTDPIVANASAVENANSCANVSSPPAVLLEEIAEGLNYSDRDKRPAVIMFDYRMPDRPIKRPDGADPAVDTEDRAVASDPTVDHGNGKGSIDVDPDDGLWGALLASDVPIILPAGLDWIGRNERNKTPSDIAVSGQDKSEVIEGWSDKNVRLAGYLTHTNPAVNDGVLRGYPALYNVVGEGSSERGTDTRALRDLPSAPFLAALIAQRGSSCVDTLYQENAAEVPPDCLRAFVEHRKTSCSKASDRDALSVAHGCEKSDDTEKPPAKIQLYDTLRQQFSLFTIALPEDQTSQSEKDYIKTLTNFYRGGGTSETGLIYERRKLIDFVSADGTNFDRLFKQIDFSGKIVVVGTSSLKAHDWHKTSLGDMSGPEVLINSTRAFMYFKPIDMNSKFWDYVSEEIRFAFAAGIGLFFPVWLRETVSRKIKRRWVDLAPRPNGAARAARLRWNVFGNFSRLVPWAVLWILLWMLSILLAFVAAISFSALSANSSPGVDFLLPTLLVILETVVEFAGLFFKGAGVVVAVMIDQVLRLFDFDNSEQNTPTETP